MNLPCYTERNDTQEKRLFLPTSSEEIEKIGWSALDVILITGDSYIDSPYCGTAVIGKVLLNAGYKVGIIAQPDVQSAKDILRLGEPTLFWGVTGGTVDSMVANYTATLRKRRSDDFTPGGINNRRPDRAVILYTNLIKRYSIHKRPIVLGGIEASLRRITHYDYWSDKLRASILFDSKADYLLYGMAESSVLELASAILSGSSPVNIRGLCYLTKTPPPEAIELPSFEEVITDKQSFIGMFHQFYQNNDAITAKTLVQKKGDRWMVHNPPAFPLTQAQLDAVYALEFEGDQHPFYEKQGAVKALDTIRFSIPTHRGCYGECNFCAIAVHEGRTVTSRSHKSVLDEVERMTHHPSFKGIIHDLSGPTANMYAIECSKKLSSGACPDKRCLFPDICPVLKIDHTRQIDLLKKVRSVAGVKKVFIGSGIRTDMVIADHHSGLEYIQEITAHHTSGQLKVAPEHIDPVILNLMGKPSPDSLMEFKRRFEIASSKAGKQQYLSYYLIAAYPGCSEFEMKQLHKFLSSELQVQPEQVQVFTPTPSTYASVMYYTETDPFSGNEIFVEKNLSRKTKQKKQVIAAEAPRQKKYIQGQKSIHSKSKTSHTHSGKAR